jgi:hypothetical protein
VSCCARNASESSRKMHITTSEKFSFIALRRPYRACVRLLAHDQDTRSRLEVLGRAARDFILALLGKATSPGPDRRAATFAVPVIPGASGFGGASGGTAGYNVAFADGVYYYLVGAGWPTGTPSPPTRAALVTAAQDLYRRVHR